MGLIIGQGSKSGGGGGGASAADKALAQNATQYGLSHNLYKVMEEVKKDPRTSGYAAIMLCQYYKGYNSLSLEGGADAFLTSDGDFYPCNTTHYWHDLNDKMFDRWVAMLFSSESGSYTCSNANICPCAALIDGTMYTITLLATNMRFAWIDVTEGSSFSQIYASGANNTIAWNRSLVLRGMREISTAGANATINLNGACSATIGLKKINNKFGFGDSSNALVLVNFEDLEQVMSGASGLFYGNNIAAGVREIYARKLTRCDRMFAVGGTQAACCSNVRKLVFPKLTSLSKFCGTSSSFANASVGYAALIHFEIGQGFITDLNLRMCTFADCILADSNALVEDVVAHPTWSNLDQWLYNFEHLIVDKLADLSGQTAKTITLAAAPYAAITESIRAKMSAKNWNLASA